MRLFHKLFLLVSMTAMVSALAIAGVLAWNLGRGFSEYLDARDAEMLEGFATEFEGRLNALAATQRKNPDSEMLERTVRQMAQNGQIGELPPRPPPRHLFSTEAPDGAAQQNRREKGPPPDAFGSRLRLIDINGQQFFGPLSGPLRREIGAVSRPISFQGKIVATAKLLPRGPAPRSIDARFLRSQYIGVAAVTVLLLLLSALFALFLARAGARKISAVRTTTNEIANGNFSARIDTNGNDEIAAMGANINAMAESLERLEGARRRWLAEISHELRTPLTVLTGELEALKDGIRPIDREAVASLSDEVRRLNLLVDDLHFLAISEIGSPLQRYSQIDAVALVRNVAVRFRSALREAGLEIEIACGSLITLPALWDAQRIEQLLGNLITNAIRYTDSSGKILVMLSTANGRAMIRVEDSAPGVCAAQFEQLFEPLHRLEEARDRVSGGSGLGLAVAKAIVLAHGGQIDAAPSELGGLQIIIDLPLDANKR